MKERTLLYTRFIIAMFLICWAAMVWQYSKDASDKIEFTRKEQIGSIYHDSIIDLIVVLQDLRELNLTNSSDVDFDKEFKVLGESVKEKITEINELQNNFGIKIGATQEWEERIKPSISNLLSIKDKKVSRNQIYSYYSDIIDNLIKIIQLTADRSNLILDPELDSYYLMNLNVKEIPYLTENISRMVIKISELLNSQEKETSIQEKVELLIMHGTVNSLSEQLVYDYSVLESLPRKESSYIEYSNRKNVVFLTQPKFLSQFYEVVVEGNRDVVEANVLKISRQVIREYVETYNQNSAELKSILDERISGFILGRYLLISFAIAVIAGVLLFYYIFKANFYKRAVAEREIIEAKENLEKQVHDRTYELRQQKSLFESIVENIPFAIFAKDVKDNYSWLFLNKKGGELFCVDSKEVVGSRDHDVFVKEQADYIHSIDERVMRSHELLDMVGDGITTLRGDFKAHSIIVPIYDDEGKPSVLLGILEDITEKQRSNAKLRMLEASVEHSEDTIIITDTNTEKGPNIIYVNPAIKGISGYKPEELIGKPLSILYGEKNSDDRRIRILRGNLKEGRSYHGEILNYAKDGTEYWVFINIFPVPDENGEIINYAAIQRDITRERAMRDELIRSKQLAELANQTKTDFLANMSHELRTPLNSILGMTRMVRESDINDYQRELINNVFQSSVNLLEIVNDILDLSKIEAGEVELEAIGFDLQYILQNVSHNMQMLATEKRLEYIENHELSGIPYVIGDPTRLGRIITNLVGNAIKYTLKGSVEIRSYYTVVDEKSIKWICEVIDSGIGIPQDKIVHIFDKFTQADISTTRKFGGTGLGLTITKELVDMMGGSIEVESEVDKGSTFRITIPFDTSDVVHSKKVHRSSVVNTGDIPAAEVKILVAEDHPMNKLLAEKMLEQMGVANFNIVENGVEVLKAIEEKEYDIILMDCHMPEKNGYDTTIDIRNKEKVSGKHISIVAMTANAMVGDRDRCIRCGMDDYVSKPIDIDELTDVLSQWIKFPNRERVVIDEKDAPKLAPVDLSLLDTFAKGDKSVRKEFIELFLSQSDKNIEILKNNCVDGHNSEWSETAHQLKGGAANMGASRLRDLTEMAQHMIIAVKQEREELFAEIEEAYNIVKEYLQKEIS